MILVEFDCQGPFDATLEQLVIMFLIDDRSSVQVVAVICKFRQ